MKRKTLNMTNKSSKETMIDTFNKFDGEQIESASKYGFYKFSFENADIAEQAFQEYNNAGGHSARESNVITVYIKNEEVNKLEIFKNIDFRMYALKIAIFSYWAFAIFSVLLFCWCFPYNALTVLIGIVIYSHFDSYLQ